MEIDREIVSRIFFVIRKFPGRIVPQTFELGNSRAQPYCIRTAPIGPIFKRESRDSIFRTAQVKHQLMVHGPSMYTLSMGISVQKKFSKNEINLKTNSFPLMASTSIDSPAPTRATQYQPHLNIHRYKEKGSHKNKYIWNNWTH